MVGSGGEGWKGGDLNLKVVDEAWSAREDNLICSRACQGLVLREVALWHGLLIAGMGGARPASTWVVLERPHIEAPPQYGGTWKLPPTRESYAELPLQLT
jgi:hypothetical protein